MPTVLTSVVTRDEVQVLHNEQKNKNEMTKHYIITKGWCNK